MDHRLSTRAPANTGSCRTFRTRWGLEAHVACLVGNVRDVPVKFMHATFYDTQGDEVLYAIKFSSRPGFRPYYQVSGSLDALHAQAEPGRWLYYTIGHARTGGAA